MGVGTVQMCLENGVGVEDLEGEFGYGGEDKVGEMGMVGLMGRVIWGEWSRRKWECRMADGGVGS